MPLSPLLAQLPKNLSKTKPALSNDKAGPSEFGHGRFNPALCGDRRAMRRGNRMPIHREIAKNNFDPERIAFLVDAYERACKVLDLSTAHADAMTEMVAKKFIELAGHGENDPQALCMRALTALGLHPQS